MALKEKKVNLQVDICDIVTIFDYNLTAVQYCHETDNEFDRLLDLWSDVQYIRGFAIKNNVQDVNNFIKKVLKNAEIIEDTLNYIFDKNQNVNAYFQPLNDNEVKVQFLSKQKGKTSILRLYAIRIDDHHFLITGGAIKMSLEMKDHIGTKIELSKINRVRDYLKDEGVVDIDSFHEFKAEHYE